MSSVKWFISTIIKTLIYKRKFYAFFRFFIDTQYRKDILHLKDLLCNYKFKSIPTTINLRDIECSHSINYSNWVEYLKSNPSSDPIKVILDGDIYRVVDGNHRLMALKQTKLPDYKVQVIEMIAISKK